MGLLPLSQCQAGSALSNGTLYFEEEGLTSFLGKQVESNLLTRDIENLPSIGL